jgi:hypothetical protein
LSGQRHDPDGRSARHARRDVCVLLSQASVCPRIRDL